MDNYLIVARSVTQAQQMESVLRREGIFGTVRRAPSAVSERGCGYTVTVRAGQLALALQVLRNAGIFVTRVVTDGAYGYREVRI